jgi:hypothetical protein
MLLSRAFRPVSAGLGLALLTTLPGLFAAPVAAQSPEGLVTHLPPDAHGFSRLWAMQNYWQQPSLVPRTYTGSITYRNYSWYMKPPTSIPAVVPSTDQTYTWNTRPRENTPPGEQSIDRTFAWYAPPGSGSTNTVGQYDRTYAWYAVPANVNAPATMEPAAEPRYVSIVGPDGRTRTFRLEGTVTQGQAPPVYVRSRVR